MQSAFATTPISPRMLWVSRILSGLPALMLLFSAVMKLAQPAPVLQEFARLGYQENVVLGIGVLELACTVIYLIPRTAVLGAILLTGYLGGAIATHVRIGDPLVNYTPVVLGILIWGGLYLRDDRVRALIPLRS
jgi:hypothetical protein